MGFFKQYQTVNGVIGHGLLYVWTELQSFFLADLPTRGGSLRPKLRPGVDFLDHDLFLS